MSIDTAGKFRDAFVAAFAPDLATAAVALVDGVLQTACDLNGFCPDAGATTNSSILLDFPTSQQYSVNAVKFSVTANVTADNTNNAVFSLVYNNGNGSTDTVIATCNTASAAAGGTGNITKDVPTACAVNALNATVPSGSAIYWKVTKAGAGGLVVTNGSSVCAKMKLTP
jgi:hypothetical protein